MKYKLYKPEYYDGNFKCFIVYGIVDDCNKFIYGKFTRIWNKEKGGDPEFLYSILNIILNYCNENDVNMFEFFDRMKNVLDLTPEEWFAD